MAKMSRASVVAAAVATCGAVLAATPAHAADLADDQAEITVVGGDILTERWQNPGAVLMTADGNHHCTGVRIAPRWVLTARHCYNHPFEDYTFNIDWVYTDSLKALKGPKSKVKKVHVAPTADTVLLELESGSRGVVIGWSDQTIPDGKTAEFYGWGYTAPYGRTVSQDLKMGKSKAAGYSAGSYYGGQNVRMRGERSCSAGGDSGGPFVSDGIAIGSLSWGMAGGGTQHCLMGIVPFAQNADWIKNTSGVQPNRSGYYFMGRR